MYKLTPEIEARIGAVYRDRLAKVYSCTPADRPAVEAAITRLYERHQDLMPSIGERLRAGQPAVRSFHWCESIRQARATLQRVGIGANASAYWGAGDTGWLTCLDQADILDRELGNKESALTAEERADVDDAIVLTQCGLVWMLDDVVILDQPAEIHIDTQGNMHNESGPAILWRDGTAEWYIGGHRVSERIVMHPDSITLDEIAEEENAEVRRIMIAQFGLERYIERSGAVVVDEDGYFGFPRVLIRLHDGSLWLWGTDSGTGRIYGMPVFEGATTCREAHEGICGFPESTITQQS